MLEYNVKSKWLYENTQVKKDKLNVLKNNDKLSNLSNNALEILYNRGFDTVDKIENFLYTGLEETHDPRLLKDAVLAVEIIIYHIKAGSHFVVYSDYDSDGACSAGIGVRGLRRAGANADYYTNNRFIEGYGITPKGVDNLVEKFPDVKVIITTDNGIVGFAGIKRAKELGIVVIVTDHHDADSEGKLPDADAIVNPKRLDCEYPFKGICGAGVIFKLMLLLYWELDLDLDYIYDMIDILAVATIGDVVPIVDENRVFVREGIKKVKQEKRVAFRALREKLSEKNKKPDQTVEINTETFGFTYVPMINALGRIDGSPDEAIELFVSDDEETIYKYVQRLDEINEYRKELTKEQQELAEVILEEKGLKEVIVLYHPTFHEGIVGLIAGRLKEKYCRPTIILSEHDGILKGSARSIPGLHMKKAFDEIKDNILGYGGHAMAAGLSVAKDKLNDFEEALIAFSKTKLTEDDYIPKIQIDTVLDAKSTTINIIDELEILEPFGEGFRKPVFGINNFHTTKPPFYMGDTKQHVKLTSGNVCMLAWNSADKYREMGEPTFVKALAYPKINAYNNTVTLQFMVQGEEFRKGK
jgi:single-stranded-DNA-specific exonuclease RecJ